MICESGQKDRGFAPNRRTDKVPPPSLGEKLSTRVMCPRYPSCEAWKPAVNLISATASVGALFERCGSICVQRRASRSCIIPPRSQCPVHCT